MIFVFSIGMLRKFMPKKEIILVLIVGFLIGAIGGAFFLEPIYKEMPSVVSVVEKNMPNNDETLYLDLSSTNDINELKNNLSHTEGFKSFDENSITITLWSFTDVEKAYFEDIVGNIDSHYKNYTVNSSGKIGIDYNFVPKTDTLILDHPTALLDAKCTIIAEKMGIKKRSTTISERVISKQTNFFMEYIMIHEDVKNTRNELATTIETYNSLQAENRGSNESYTCFIIKPSPYDGVLIVKKTSWNDDSNL